MIKLKKGDEVVWWDRKTLRTHLLRVVKPVLNNQHGVPLNFTAAGLVGVTPGKAKRVTKRLSQLDQDKVLILAPESEWKTFIPFDLPDHIVVARMPRHAQPTYGLFNTNVANVGWVQLHGIQRTQQEIPLQFWKHGPKPGDLDWCLTRGEADSEIDWRWPINRDLSDLLAGVDIND